MGNNIMDDHFIEYQRPKSPCETSRSLSSERYPILVKNIDGTFALEAVSGKDHTYAQKRGSLPSANGTNDHNYSCRRISLWERQHNRKYVVANDANRRSSSEENLVRTEFNIDECGNDSKIHKINARKCHSVEEMVSEDIEIACTSKIPAEIAQSSDRKCLPTGQRESKQACEDPVYHNVCHGHDHQYARDLEVLSSNGIRNLKISHSPQCHGHDHQYARDLEVISRNGIRNLNISHSPQTTNRGGEWKSTEADQCPTSEAVMLAQVLDHSYGKTLSFNSNALHQSLQKAEQMVQTDHTYSGVLRNSNCAFKPSKYSCTINASNWLQFEKDHTYSTKINSNA